VWGGCGMFTLLVWISVRVWISGWVGGDEGEGEGAG